MSREIDQLIAEKVMGWRTHSHSPFMWYTGGTSRLKTDFCPSKDIGNAWEVVEKMNCPYCMWNDEDGNHLIHFGNMEHIGKSEEAPMAIAIASLKAKGVEVGE